MLAFFSTWGFVFIDVACTLFMLRCNGATGTLAIVLFLASSLLCYSTFIGNEVHTYALAIFHPQATRSMRQKAFVLALVVLDSSCFLLLEVDVALNNYVFYL